MQELINFVQIALYFNKMSKKTSHDHKVLIGSEQKKIDKPFDACSEPAFDHLVLSCLSRGHTFNQLWLEANISVV